MSFNTKVKNELCKALPGCPGCACAEALGLMLYAGRFTPSEIRLQAENPAVRRRIISTLKAASGVTLLSDGSAVFCDDTQDVQKIYAAFGYDSGSASLQLNHALVEEDCCKAAFLRGVLLSGGCVTSPEKGYHLEIVSCHYHVARQTATLLSEMDYTPGYIQRRGNHILYFKDSSAIEDILSRAGSPRTAMDIMLKKVERDLNNKINRKVNCDTANLDKTVAAAGKQIEAIEKLKACGRLDTLSPSMQETANLRLSNPELSIASLCALHTEPITKPGLNNRLKRLIKLSEEI